VRALSPVDPVLIHPNAKPHMNLNDMRISTRLALGFGILTLLIALMVGISIIRSSAVGDAFDTVVNQRYAKIAALNNIKGGLNQIARSLRNAVIMSDPADVRKELEVVESTRKVIVDQWGTLQAQIRSEKGKALVERATDARSKYAALQLKFTDLIAAGKTDEARSLLLGELRPTQLAYFAALDDLIAYQKEAMDESTSQAFAEIASMKAVILVCGGVALMIAVLMGIWTIRAITGPISQAVKISRAVADGDLSVKFDAVGKNETAQLLRALKDMQASLVKVVSGVRQNAEAVAAASAQIAQGNTDLSQRTEEQAASLEETASSMEELTGTVRQNADNAKQATRLATTASGIAQRGGEVVGRVVETMQGISGSSIKVAEIISVIEGIAFQTNILALNAAVEAARAGEQGRGFAVVAGEVRTLAQRSATAAKEIKDLISESVTRVDAGSKLVNEAGSTIGEVVQAVKRVTDIVSEISAASEEQSTGIEQVNTAVVQMDQVTQQNAALVEEASAAAHSMVQQAKALRDAVAVFRIDANGTSASRVTANPKSEPRRSVLTAPPSSRAALTKPETTPVVTTGRKTVVATDNGDAVDWQAF